MDFATLYKHVVTLFLWYWNLELHFGALTIPVWMIIFFEGICVVLIWFIHKFTD